jgi:hypothetical protein
MEMQHAGIRNDILIGAAVAVVVLVVENEYDSMYHSYEFAI